MKLKKTISLTACIFAVCSAARAQTETLDIATFTPPAGWNKQAKEGVAIYVDSTPKGYCLISVYQSKKSSGNPEADFQSEWRELIVKPFRVTNPPAVQPAEESGGWKSLAGASGQVGNAKFYDVKYSGKFSVTNWEATLSNFNQRSTTGFDAYFEAVKGGRILHLTDKAARGTQYHLVKVK
jgi:hypothetical protein